MKINSKIYKAALLLVGLCNFTPIAFCTGTVTGKVNRSKTCETSNGAVRYGKVNGTVEASMARYRKGVVVYLKGVNENVIPKNATMDQKNLEFIPHVVVVPVGSTVSFINSDKVNHDIFSASACKKMDIDNFHPGSTRTEFFGMACAVNLLCDLHSEMSGFVVVVDSNHFAVTGTDGKFMIGQVPPGTYDVAVWSEKLKPQRKMTVTVNSGQTSTIEIPLMK
jgi:plastocyanin